jgi:cytoskeletal protein RodZ
MRSKVLAILLLCFCINLVVAGRWGVHIQRRDGPTSPSITATQNSASPSQPTSDKASQTGDSGRSGIKNGDASTTSQSDKTPTTSGDNAKVTTSSNSSSVTSSATSSSAVVAVTSNILGAAATSTINNSFYNCMSRSRLLHSFC